MKKLLVAFVLLAPFCGAFAQKVSQSFTNMPADLLPGVTVDTRKDLIDFYNNGNAAIMPAPFGGKVQLKKLTDDYLMFKTSENSDVQIKALDYPGKKEKVLAFINTVYGPLKDSRVRFFTPFWQPVAGCVFPVFAVRDFVNVNKLDSAGLGDRLNEFGPRLFVEIRFRPGSSGFTAYSSLREDMEKARKEQLGAFIRDSLNYSFSDGIFRPE